MMVDGTKSSSVRARFVKHAALQKDYNTNFVEFAQNLSNPTIQSLKNPTRNVIFTDTVHKTSITISEILIHLKNHLLNHRVQIGPGRYYQQITGIPQGSIMSTWLCNVYYGHMEQTLCMQQKLPLQIHELYPEIDWRKRQENINERNDTNAKNIINASKNTKNTKRQEDRYPSTIAVRCTDDMLILSTNVNEARQFVNTMVAGIPEYNCNVAVHKTQTNFILSTVSSSSSSSSSSTSFTATSHVPQQKITYCGLTIDSKTGNINADYSKYYTLHISTLVTIPTVMTGVVLKRLTKGFLKPRAHALLFDTSINDVANVYFNIYEIGLLAAMKFHVHVLQMKQGPNQQYQFFYNTILETAEYMIWLVKDRTNCRKFQCEFQLKDMDVWSAVIISFIHVLSRKRSRYALVLNELNGLQCSDMNRDMKKSLMLEQIKF